MISTNRAYEEGKRDGKKIERKRIFEILEKKKFDSRFGGYVLWKDIMEEME